MAWTPRCCAAGSDRAARRLKPRKTWRTVLGAARLLLLLPGRARRPPPAPSGCSLPSAAGITTAFTPHSDPSPAIYLTGRPAPDAAVTRAFDRAPAGIEVPNPLSTRVEPLFAR